MQTGCERKGHRVMFFLAKNGWMFANRESTRVMVMQIGSIFYEWLQSRTDYAEVELMR